jgi:LmbE family N-acetylglucosaminyl deacetylase
MFQLPLPVPQDRALRLLCLGAHCDDIEIGCGGTILTMIDRLGAEKLEITWVVFGSTPVRAREALHGAELFLSGVTKKEILVKDHRDGFFPDQWASIKEEFEEIRRGFEPDIVLTHYRDDRHQDHRVLSDLAWNTFRDHLVLEYEIPKYDGDLGIPNLFVPLEPEVVARKVRMVLETYESQRSKHWFTEDTLRGLMRIRGIESAERGGYAEAFHARKVVLGPARS